MSASLHHFQSLPPSPVRQGIAVSEARSSSLAASGTVSFTMILLRAIAAHDRVSVASVDPATAFEHAKRIGLSPLARAVADLNREGGVQ